MSDNRENKHNEEPHDSEEEKYSFLQETVKDEQRSKKGIMGNLCRLAGRGLIFGLAAGLALSLIHIYFILIQNLKIYKRNLCLKIDTIELEMSN